MNGFCTLFDAGYLDRGILLARSLIETTSNYTLYIFAFDRTSYDCLVNLDLENTVIISEEEIMTSQLKIIKEERSRSEYLWTCSPIIVEYVLEKYDIENCTYIDADMYFYQDASILVSEVYAAGCSVGIVEHRFPNNIAKAINEKYYGRFCVEFNVFINDTIGQEVLRWWKDKCIECCTSESKGEIYGDQKYLDLWPERFEKVHIIDHKGAGVAPWNACDYRMIDSPQKIKLIYKRKELCELVFFHFQGITTLGNKTVNIGIYNEIGRQDDSFVREVYWNYIVKMLATRKLLENNYNIISKILPPKKGERLLFKGVRETILYLYLVLIFVTRNKKNIYRIGNENESTGCGICV